jgi:hypothetical protein
MSKHWATDTVACRGRASRPTYDPQLRFRRPPAVPGGPILWAVLRPVTCGDHHRRRPQWNQPRPPASAGHPGSGRRAQFHVGQSAGAAGARPADRMHRERSTT